MDDRDAIDRAIVQMLTVLFDGDVDRIQAWLDAPNTHLELARPVDWWSGGRKGELLTYLQRAYRRRAGEGAGWSC